MLLVINHSKFLGGVSRVGNFVRFGCPPSSWLILTLDSKNAARNGLVVFGSIGLMWLIPTIFTVELYLSTLLFGLARFAYGASSTIANVLPADLFKSDSVASMSGLIGTAPGVARPDYAFELIGRFSDARQARATQSIRSLWLRS